MNIYNSAGQLAQSIYKADEFNTQTIRIQDLPTGSLIFEFDNGNEKLTKKVRDLENNKLRKMMKYIF